MFLPAIFLFVTFHYHISFGQDAEFYIHPNGNSSQCPNGTIGTTCLTFYQSVASITPQMFLDNAATIFHFLPGIHSLNSSANIVNGANASVTFQGLSEMREGPHVTVLESSAVIQCDENITIHIETFQSVQLSNITLKNCGKPFNSNLDLLNSSAVTITNAVNVALSFVSILDSPGGALTLSAVNCLVSHSSFYSNSLDSQSAAISVIYQTALNSYYSTVKWSFVMNYSNITNNQLIGLLLNPVQNNYHVNIYLESLLIANNSGINVGIIATTDRYDLSVNGLNSSGSIFGFLLNQTESLIQTESIVHHRPFIFLSNCLISYNLVFGMAILWSSSLSGTFYLNSSSFHHNAGIFGSALEVGTNQFANSQNSFDVLLYNTVFDGNTINRSYAEFASVNPSFTVTVVISNCRNVVISNCNFTNNEGSGLVLIDTYVTFHGVNNFSNNSASVGGGIYMISTSILFLAPGSLLRFVNNHASDTGGAIHVEQVVLTLYSDRESVTNHCFYQLQAAGGVSNKHFYFENNTAGIAGTVLYGGAIMSCLQADLSSISTFVNQSGLSILSSDPRGVCFCNASIPDCSLKNLTMNAIPGESIGFSVIVIGQQNNATTGIVSISSSGVHSNHNISSALCNDFSHKITVEDSSNNSITVNVTLSDFETNFLQSPLTINVNIQPCLAGTYLSTQSHICVCEDSIKAATTNCDGVNATVTKEGTSWVGGFQNCTIVYNICPYDYCIPESVTYLLSDPDRQCALNRSGLLCGGCDEGLSLMLGSNKCGQCTNDYLALIIPFFLAGIVLVVLLIVLNLTVTVGTINGLLFFANLLKIYEPLLSGIANVPILNQFISWINLDLGIETCFFDGMNSCYKTLLQFVFPFYLWFLIILIILLSQRFSKLSRIIGNNAVPVLCTLLLLSYTKLLRTFISIFIFATFSSTCTSNVWFNSGEPYFTGCHLGLFIIAFPALIVLFVPYTLFLLFFPLWELCRSKWTIGTSLFLKLKPFFDAYAGPHTEQFRVWPGLLILARIVLAVIVATFPVSQVPLALLVAITIVLIVTLSFGSVYKNKRLHSLDIFYLLCLLVIFYVILGAFIENNSETGRIYFSRRTAKIGVGIINSVNFIGFIAILAYHVYIRFPWSKIKKVMGKHETLQMEDIMSEENVSYKAAPKTTVISELREPLLELIED